MNNKITSFRNFLGLFLLISMFTITANAQTVVFTEDFSSITVGNSDDSNGSNSAWNGNTNFIVDGTNSKAYQAGGAVRLGTSSAIGFMTSIPIDLSEGGGAYTISFDIKGWSAAGSIKVIVKDEEGATIAEETVAYSNFNTSSTIGAFETKTLNLTGGVENATIRFETTTIPANSARRAFIDNVVVTVPEVNTIDAPVATAATDVTYSSFVANWQAVADADYYTIEISTSPDFATVLPGWDDWEASAPSQTVAQLTGNTTYYYRIAAVNENGTSAFSNVIEVTTACGPFTYPAVNNIEFCGGATVADLPLSLSAYHWYALEAGGSPLADDAPLTSGTIYYTNYFDNCESPRQPYAVQINIVDAPEYTDNEIEVCHSGTIADITLPDSGYLFYTDNTGGTPLVGTTPLVNGATYFVSRTIGECESARTEVIVEIEIPAIPAGAQTQQFTAGQTLADLNVTADGELVWYAEASLETELEPSTPLMNNITYYAVNVDAPCMSEYLAVTVTQTMGTSLFGVEGLTAYPNPVHDVFTVIFTEPINNVTVYNMLGQVVMNNNSNATSTQVNMASLAAGTYTVKVVCGAQTANFKIVKQ